MRHANDAPELVDWEFAVATGRRLAPAGPQLSRSDAVDVVQSLRELAQEAEHHVVEYTRLSPQGAAPPVVVVDRAEWIRSNVAGMRELTSPLLAKLAERGSGALSLAIGRRLTALQVGSALAFLSTKVLGQFEVFLPTNGDGADTSRGRLSLVAPNIAEVEGRLGVSPRDFRLWVCLHEQTHRVQFHAVPWLRSHLEDEIASFIEVTDLDPSALAKRIRDAVVAMRGRRRSVGGDRPAGSNTANGDDSGISLLEALQTPAQRAVLDRLQALMSLLEGHADQVMDAVGPQVVPSVREIRQRFEQRRAGTSVLDRFIRKLLGLDLKLKQYRQGGAFVRAIVEREGVDAFNRVWTSPETLPSRAEIADPDAWMVRVLGAPAPSGAPAIRS